MKNDPVLLDHKPDSGITRLFHYDEAEDKATIETIQDVGEIVETNKALFNETDKHTQYGEFTRVASIPMSVYFDLQKRGIIGDQKRMKEWLNHSDQRAFRVRAGAV